MALTPDQIQEAIKELEDQGFVIVHKDRGHIGDKDKQEISREIEHYDSMIKERLHKLCKKFGLAANNKNNRLILSEEFLHKPDLEGKVHLHELYDLQMLIAQVSVLKESVRYHRVVDLHKSSIEIGATMIWGREANHHYDDQRNFRYTRQNTGRERKDLDNYNQIKTFCIKEASRIWKRSPSVRLGGRQGMVERLAEKLPVKFQNIPDEKLPADSSIKKYLIQADQAGQITIPPEARKRGAPPKK